MSSQSARKAFEDYAESLGHPLRADTALRDKLQRASGSLALIAIGILRVAGLSWGWAVFWVIGPSVLVGVLNALAKRGA